MIPIQLFPQWGQEVLRFTPFPHVTNYPIISFQYGMDTAVWLENIAIGVAWWGLLQALIVVVWRRGLKQYAGVGI